MANAEYMLQLIRSGSSPGDNYIEANESIGDKDFKMKIKTPHICSFTANCI